MRNSLHSAIGAGLAGRRATGANFPAKLSSPSWPGSLALGRAEPRAWRGRGAITTAPSARKSASVTPTGLSQTRAGRSAKSARRRAHRSRPATDRANVAGSKPVARTGLLAVRSSRTRLESASRPSPQIGWRQPPSPPYTLSVNAGRLGGASPHPLRRKWEEDHDRFVSCRCVT
jgi:hypothetical protein